MDATLIESIRRWQAVDPDAETVAELDELIAAGDGGELADRFAGTLQFGTAGLRAAIAAGPMRMNRVVVRHATWGVAQWLIESDAAGRERGLVIGYDGRRNSEAFAHDVAAVAAALGVRVRLFTLMVPTPVLAAATISLNAGLGIMITASHNPPQDNGYKVFLADGSQIVAPVDAQMATWIAGAPHDVPVEPESTLIERVGSELVDSFVSLIPPVTDSGVRVAYTAMHGVGGDVLVQAFKHAGLAAPVCVGEQFHPDGTFPTVAFPNPEEPGALDLLMALAAREHCDLAVANDPDADRLGAAIPMHDGSWRRLGGDEIGWLLADHLLETTEGEDRLVITTVVSSTLLSDMARNHGVRYAEAFTGFKWIADAIRQHPESRFIFGYEQALGYLVTDRLRDKDGISAAVMLAEIAARLKRRGVSIQQRLDHFVDSYGRHVIADTSVKMPPEDGRAAVERLRADPPSEIAGVTVTETVWIDEAGLLRLQCGPTTRVQVRPSGTEPKVKVYAEAVNEDPAPLLAAVAAMLV